MLMNNLDPEVAERPDDLVVYGGTGRPRAAGRRSTRSCAPSRPGAGRDAARAVRQAGRRVPHARVGAARAHRQLEPRRRLGDLARVPPARGARPHHVRPDDRRILDLHRHAGHPAGHVRDLRARVAAQAVRRHPRRHAHPHRRRRRHGRRAAARRHDERGRRADRRRRRVPPRSAASTTATSTSSPTDLDDAVARVLAAKAERRAALRRRSSATRRRCSPSCSRRGVPIDIVTDQTSAHDPLSYLPEGVSVDEWHDARRRRPRGVHRRAPAPRWPSTSRRWSGSRMPAPRCSTTATRSAPRRSSAATSAPSTSPASCPRTSGRCSPRARARSAGRRSRGDPADIAATDRAILELFPEDEHLRRWITQAGEKVHFEGLPARICWLGYKERHLAGLRFNEMVASRRALARPIVIGRDHLDSGSVASPYRETESMADGSDAIADWPLLNALLNTASGATWVSIHHGGGVGIGRSIHAGQVDRRRRHAARRREDRARADQRPGHRRHAPRRRGLRARGRGRARSAACASRCSEQTDDARACRRRWSPGSASWSPTIRRTPGALGLVPDAALLIVDGRVAWIGPGTPSRADASPTPTRSVDVGGAAVIPGFVDSHTHLVFGGDRAAEFEARMSGQPYTAGGIRSTVAATRAATDAELRARLRRLRRRAARPGHDDVRDQERLRADGRRRGAAARASPREVTDETTFLGAHVVPAEFADDPDALRRPRRRPDARRLRAARPLDRRVLRDRGVHGGAVAPHPDARAPRAGSACALHASQLGPGDGVALAVELDAASVDHCTYLTDDDVDRAGRRPTPSRRCCRASSSPPASRIPDARRLIDAGVTVALASDCNPGSSFTSSMPFCIAVAVRDMGMTPAEALWAATARRRGRAAPRRRRPPRRRAPAPTSSCCAPRPTCTSPTAPASPSSPAPSAPEPRSPGR